MQQIIFITTSIAVFNGVILALVTSIILVAKKLTPGGSVKIDINDGDKVYEVETGASLLATLADENIYLPSACGWWRNMRDV